MAVAGRSLRVHGEYVWRSRERVWRRVRARHGLASRAEARPALCGLHSRQYDPAARRGRVPFGRTHLVGHVSEFYLAGERRLATVPSCLDCEFHGVPSGLRRAVLYLAAVVLAAASTRPPPLRG